MNLWNPSVVAALLSSDFCVRLTHSLLHFLWQGLAVGAGVWVLDRLLRSASAQARYAVGAAGLLVMLACVPATYLALGRLPVGAPADVANRESTPVADASAASGGNALAGPHDARIASFRPASDEDLARAEGADANQPGISAWQSLSSLPAWIAPYATLAYLAGVAIMLSRLALALRNGQQLRQSATPLSDPAILAMAARQARRIGLKVVPAIAWCQRAAVPLVVGIVRPMVLLPTAIGSGLSPDQLEALLAHELAHLKRLDLLVNLGQRLAESLLFFHPAVWYVSRNISIERENCCDDCVLRAGWGRVEYADALVRMAEVCAAVRGFVGLEGAALLAASGDHPSQFKRRVLRLLNTQDDLRIGISRGWLLASAGAVLLGLATVPFAASWRGGAEAGQEEKIQPPAAKSPATAGVNTSVVHDSLKFLASRQNDDGSFGSGGFPLDRSPALTAICGLALVHGDIITDPGPEKASGFVPAKYARERDKALEFLLKQQRDSGLFSDAEQPTSALMVNHGFAMWCLADAAVAGSKVAVKEPLAKAVALTVSAQNGDGGWRYLPKPADADAHITAVQLLALSAARRANVEVPQDVIDKAVGYLKRCRDEQSGGFAYLPGLKQSSFSRSALVLAAITAANGADDEWLKPSIDYLVKHAAEPRQFDPELYVGDGRWLALLALHGSKGHEDQWRQLDRQFRAELLRERQPEGSWREPKVGPERATALACLLLLSPPPVKEDQAAAEPPFAAPTNVSFRETPWPEVLAWYGKIMNQTVEMKEVPGGNFTYESPRPLNQREIALLINREVVRRGYCLVERNGSLTVETADVIARQYAESMRKDFMYGHELRKGPDPFDAYFEIVACRAIGETRPPAPEGPAIAYVLKARRDFTAGQLTDFLNACFGTVSVPSLETGRPILADGFAVMHGEKWLGANAPALKFGEQIEVWQNNFQEWNARPPADYRLAIDGQVIGADGKRLPAAHVHTLLLEEGTEFPGWAFGGEAVVDRQGKFQVSLQHATQFVSKVYLWASAPGHAPQRIGPIAVGFGKPAVPLTIELKPGFAGRLRLVLPDGTAMDRGEVEIAAQDELWAAGIPLAKLPINGEPIRIENCPAGPLLVKVRVPGVDDREVRDVQLTTDEVVEVRVPPARNEKLYYRGQEALERIKKVKPAWSETQNGIEFGVAIIDGKTKFRSSERVRLEMFVRNVGQEAVVVRFPAEFYGNVPEIRSASGESISVERVVLSGSVAIWKESLKPGEAFGFRHPGVGLGRNTWHPYVAELQPGKYTLKHTHEIDVDPADGQAPGKRLRFASGSVEFEFVDGAASNGRTSRDDTNRALEAAQLERQEYLEGTFPNDERRLAGELLAAEQALSKSQASLAHSKRLAAKGLIAEIQLQAAEAAVKQSQIQLELAQGKLDVLRKFTRPKVLRELERKVVEALDALLDQRVALHVTDKPLVEVLDELEKTHGAPIVIDLKAIHARGLSIQARVTIDVTDTPLREVLKAVLASSGLNFEVTGSGIAIPAGAKPAAADGAKKPESPTRILARYDIPGAEEEGQIFVQHIGGRDDLSPQQQRIHAGHLGVLAAFAPAEVTNTLAQPSAPCHSVDECQVGGSEAAPSSRVWIHCCCKDAGGWHEAPLVIGLCNRSCDCRFRVGSIAA